MSIVDETNQKIICYLTPDESKKCHEVANRLRPGYNGTRYVNMIFGFGNYGLYEIQKFVFRETFVRQQDE